jgi:hypothetical protein
VHKRIVTVKIYAARLEEINHNTLKLVWKILKKMIDSQMIIDKCIEIGKNKR